MPEVVMIISGLPEVAFRRVSSIPMKKFVPSGRLLTKPVLYPGSYPHQQAAEYIEEAHSYAASLPEATRISVLLAYVDYGDQTTRRFVDSFFPFALSRALDPLDLTGVTRAHTKNHRLNEYARYLMRVARDLIARAGTITAETSAANLTPLLLPVRNFHEDEFGEILWRLYDELGAAAEPQAVLKAAKDEFLSKCPLTHPEEKGRQKRQHCFSDGKLYFQSPGNHRHGYYRHKNEEGHKFECLLNARSRLGGRYDHSFHFDCRPVKGKHLSPHYPNCHDEECAPGKGHVNIAPNDYVI